MKINCYDRGILVLGAVVIFVAFAAGASELDQRVEATAKNSYAFKTSLKNDNVHVSSKDGNVTLMGTVNQEQDKFIAQEAVVHLPAVTHVDNQLELKGENPFEKSDAWLVLKVNTALLFHQNMSAPNTQVTVKNGVVTLRGEARSHEQKKLTGAFAKDVELVKEVKNELTVNPNR